MAVALFTDMIDYNGTRKNIFGFVLMAVAGLFLTLGNSLFQFIEMESQTHISSSQMLIIRCIVQLMFSIVFMIFGKIHIYGEFKKNVIPLIAMGVAEVCVIIFMYESIERMPVGDATVLQFTAPIFTIILSFIVFKTACRWLDALCGIISFVGVVFILKPNILFSTNISAVNEITHLHSSHFHDNVNTTTNIIANSSAGTLSSMKYTEGGCFAIAAAFCMSIFFILNKLNGTKLDVTLTIFYPSVMGIIIGPFVMLCRGEKILFGLSGQSWAIVFFIGFTSFIGLMLLGQSLQMQDPGPAILIRNCDVVYAYIFQYLLIHKPPTNSAGVGTITIITCTSLMVLNHHFNLDKKYCSDRCCGKEDTNDNHDDEEMNLTLLNNNNNNNNNNNDESEEEELTN